MSLNPNSTGNVLFAIQNNSINCSIARQDKQCCYFLSNHEVAMDATHPAGDHHTSSGRADFFRHWLSSAKNMALSQSCLLEAKWGSRSNRRHVMLGMTAIISSTGSCQVLCVSLDTAMVLRVMTPHDREGPETSSHARHEREF